LALLLTKTGNDTRRKNEMNTKGITAITVIAFIVISTIVIAYIQYHGDVQGYDKIISDLSAKDLATLGNPSVNVASSANTLSQFKSSVGNATVYYQRSYDSATFYLIVSGTPGTGNPPVYQSISVISWQTRWDGWYIPGGSLLNP
jgi:hypothetical protein